MKDAMPTVGVLLIIGLVFVAFVPWGEMFSPKPPQPKLQTGILPVDSNLTMGEMFGELPAWVQPVMFFVPKGDTFFAVYLRFTRPTKEYQWDSIKVPGRLRHWYYKQARNTKKPVPPREANDGN